jgi:SAM-dependent methyltransferase
MVAVETNEVERIRWNTPSWVDNWPKRERLTAIMTPLLLAALELRPGDHVLDIGCGGGLATIAAGGMVGSAGSATGADISAGLVTLASRRAAEANARNVSFHVKDVQQDQVEGAPFDAAMSQFGVMFFDEPKVAFANIRAQLAPAARLAFVCWQSAANNPWHYAAVIKNVVPPPPPPAPGKSPTGPFAFAEPNYVLEILSDAGFVGAAIANHNLAVETPLDSIVDDAQLITNGVPPDLMDDAWAAVNRHMAGFRLPSGLYRFPLAVQIVTARNQPA